MVKWTNPDNVENFTQYYLYLLFSYHGRIGRWDFISGFFAYVGLILISSFSLFICILINEFLDDDIFWLFFIMSIFFGIICFFPMIYLPLKRLKDIGWGEDARAVILFVSYACTIFFGMGPLLLLIGCFFTSEQIYGNPNGKRCTIYEDLSNERERLVNAAKSCLRQNNFEGAILNYEELGAKALVITVKKRHISHNSDLLHSQVTRMIGKGVLCEDLIKTHNDLTHSVNNYLGLAPSEFKKGPKNEQSP